MGQTGPRISFINTALRAPPAMAAGPNRPFMSCSWTPAAPASWAFPMEAVPFQLSRRPLTIVQNRHWSFLDNMDYWHDLWSQHS